MRSVLPTIILGSTLAACASGPITDPSSPLVQKATEQARNAGDAPPSEMAKQLVAADLNHILNDPQDRNAGFAALFRGALYAPPNVETGGFFVCGFIDIKIGYLGYTGTRIFYSHLIRQGNSWKSETILDSSDTNLARVLCDSIIPVVRAPVITELPPAKIQTADAESVVINQVVEPTNQEVSADLVAKWLAVGVYGDFVVAASFDAQGQWMKRGLVINAILPKGALGRAGLRVGDKVTELDDHRMADVGTFYTALDSLTRGRKFTVTFLRGTQELTVETSI